MMVRADLLKYADDELRKALAPAVEPAADGVNRVIHVEQRPRFKYVDGVERLSDLELPFVIDLPNGSVEAVFLTASKNAGCGCVPIMEWCNGRRTVLDRDGKNGVFLASHDPTMKALIFKTVESVPEIIDSCATNTIEGEFRGSRIHDQLISWTDSNRTTSTCDFNIHTLKATCTCKYYLKVTENQLPDVKRFCTHIIGQLRRVIFMN